MMTAGDARRPVRRSGPARPARRARPRRPHLGLRARGRRRGAGALADAVAAARPPGAVPLDDRRRRRRPDRLRRRDDVLGARSSTTTSAPTAGGRGADRQLPDAGPRDGGRRPRCWPRRHRRRAAARRPGRATGDPARSGCPATDAGRRRAGRRRRRCAADDAGARRRPVRRRSSPRAGTRLFPDALGDCGRRAPRRRPLAERVERRSPSTTPRAWSSTASRSSTRRRDRRASRARGVNDLYVALTRPTQRLTVLHHGDLPPGLTGLPE